MIFTMDKVFTQEVIITTMLRRGKGVEGDPVRIVTEVFTKDGKKIAEYDPEASDISFMSDER